MQFFDEGFTDIFGSSVINLTIQVKIQDGSTIISQSQGNLAYLINNGKIFPNTNSFITFIFYGTTFSYMAGYTNWNNTIESIIETKSIVIPFEEFEAQRYSLTDVQDQKTRILSFSYPTGDTLIYAIKVEQSNCVQNIYLGEFENTLIQLSKTCRYTQFLPLFSKPGINLITFFNNLPIFIDGKISKKIKK